VKQNAKTGQSIPFSPAKFCVNLYGHELLQITKQHKIWLELHLVPACSCLVRSGNNHRWCKLYGALEQTLESFEF